METTPSRCRVTAIVLTRDEEMNIEPCLQSLAWADEVVIADSFSTDRTLELAQRARPDVRAIQRAFTDFGDQRNWAMDNAMPRNDWILFVDADERITSACARAIEAAIASPGDKAGFFLTCRNFFMGRWIKHCTLYPSWQLRLFRKGQVRFRKEGHGQREVSEAPLGYLREPYDHFGFSKGVEHWKARHKVYAANEAELIFRLRSEPLALGEFFSRDPVIRRRCLKRLAARTPFRPLFRFLYIYVWRRGFLDGRPGFVFAMLRVGHEIRIAAQLTELDRRSK